MAITLGLMVYAFSMDSKKNQPFVFYLILKGTLLLWVVYFSYYWNDITAFLDYFCSNFSCSGWGVSE